MQVSYNGSESLSLNKGPWSQYYWSKHINLAHAYCQLSMITMATLIYIQDHISPYMFSHIDQNRILSSFLVFANLTGDTEHLAATISFPFPNWWWLSSVILQPSRPSLGIGSENSERKAICRQRRNVLKTTGAPASQSRAEKSFRVETFILRPGR